MLSTLRSKLHRRVEISKVVSRFNLGITGAQRRRYRMLSADQERALRETILQNYPLEPGNAEADLADHLYGRLDSNRIDLIPWFSSVMPLNGRRILEIGAGTGCSAVAMAEQGAEVTGIDIQEASLAVARRRCELYGLAATFITMNAVGIADRFAADRFDAVIFFASFEHMTIDERIESLIAAHHILSPGGILAIVETPNRLWYFDGHTSNLPFFHWLPDTLAIRYARTSPRPSFAQAALDPLSLARAGRGASFHELEVALGDGVQQAIVSNLTDFMRMNNPLRFVHGLVSRERRYERFLESTYPQINRAFFRDSLNVMVRKTSVGEPTPATGRSAR